MSLVSPSEESFLLPLCQPHRSALRFTSSSGRTRRSRPRQIVRELCGTEPKNLQREPRRLLRNGLFSLDLAVGACGGLPGREAFKRVQILLGGLPACVTSIVAMVYENMRPRNVPVKLC